MQLKALTARISEDTHEVDRDHEFLKNGIGIVFRGRDIKDDDGYSTKWRGMQIELNTTGEGVLSGKVKTNVVWNSSYTDTIKWLNGNSKDDRGPWSDFFCVWDWSQLPPTERVALIKKVISAATELTTKNI